MNLYEKHTARSFLVLILLILKCVLPEDSKGQTGWYALNNANATSYKAVYFLDNNTGFIGGDFNEMLRSTNGGSSWYSVFPGGAAVYVSGITFLDSNTGWFCGGAVYSMADAYYCFVYKSVNKGQTWSQIYISTYYSANHFYFPGSIKFLNANTGIMTFWGLKDPNLQTQIGKIMRTTNGGVSWRSVDSSVSCYSVSSIGNKLAVAGFYRNQDYIDTGYVKTSTDLGLTWKNALVLPRSGYFGSDMTDENTIYASGYIITDSQYAVVSKSTNFGRNWINSKGRNNRYFRSIDMLNYNTGWACGNLGVIYKTTNSGTNWYKQATPTTQLLNSIFIVNSAYGYSVGENSAVLKTTTGGEPFSSYSSVMTGLPQSFSIYQNYPNPFNPNTIINYELPFSSEVKIKIYNVLGNEIETLVNEKQNSGSYSVTFDGSDYPGGVYLYKLEIDGNVIDAKRMVLLK